MFLSVCLEGGNKVPMLEKKLAQRQAENEPVGPILKALIQALCNSGVRVSPLVSFLVYS